MKNHNILIFLNYVFILLLIFFLILLINKHRYNDDNNYNIKRKTL